LNAAGEAKAGKVTIQIGSYNEAAQAEERVANLKSAGYEARSVAVEIPKRGTWYRVQSGRFVNRDEAEQYGRQLRERGVVSSFITTDVQE
jgi:DedD protein